MLDYRGVGLERFHCTYIHTYIHRYAHMSVYTHSTCSEFYLLLSQKCTSFLFRNFNFAPLKTTLFPSLTSFEILHLVHCASILLCLNSFTLLWVFNNEALKGSEACPSCLHYLSVATREVVQSICGVYRNGTIATRSQNMKMMCM